MWPRAGHWGACWSRWSRPAIFRTFLEWPIGLVLAYLLAGTALLLPGTLGRARAARYLAAVNVIGGLACLLSALVWQAVRYHDDAVTRVRNFYGALTILEDDPNDPDLHSCYLVHANTTHGAQLVDSPDRNVPTTYYTEDSGVGQAVRYLQDEKPRMRVGVIGLGTGTMAAYARKGDDYQFYEINPAVPRLARTYFHYLGDCRGACTINMGDARLSLERQPPQPSTCW